MSASVNPWLQNAAERYTSNVVKTGNELAPPRQKGHKVQIVKFLTFRPMDDPCASLDIWAQVTDPDHFIACRFLAAAVTRFRSERAPFVDLTSLKGSVILVRSYRISIWEGPIPAQIMNSPWANIRRTFPPTTTPVLEVDDWTVLGCLGEAQFWETAHEVTLSPRRSSGPDTRA